MKYCTMCRKPYDAAECPCHWSDYQAWLDSRQPSPTIETYLRSPLWRHGAMRYHTVVLADGQVVAEGFGDTSRDALDAANAAWLEMQRRATERIVVLPEWHNQRHLGA